jgi:hypothetical protein
MRVGIRSRLAMSTILKVLLLGVGTIAMVIPGSVLAFSQSGTGTSAHASLFTAIELHPSGFDTSEASGISGGQEVGYAEVAFPMGPNHAMLWRGSASTAVDLTPRGASWAFAFAACGGQQVGSGQLDPIGRDIHALLWRGSADSVVDLHPRGFISSTASGTSGGEQVGSGALGSGGWPSHALLWHGSADSVVDLHPRGFTSSTASGTSGGEQVGSGALSGTSGPSHALLWHGSADSVVDLHPRGFISSDALGTSGGEQVGRGIPLGGSLDTDNSPGTYHALLWRGSAASVVDLHPHGFTSSFASGVSGGEQVGWGYGPATGGNRHALLWRGSASSVMDLHTFLPPDFVSSAALDIDAAGDVVGLASGSNISISHAFLWKRRVPKPAASGGQHTTRCENP